MEEAKPKLADEMAKMQAEPLLPAEKKLIAWSLILGVVLLAVLAAISLAFFSPATEEQAAAQRPDGASAQPR